LPCRFFAEKEFLFVLTDSHKDHEKIGKKTCNQLKFNSFINLSVIVYAQIDFVAIINDVNLEQNPCH